MSESFKRFQKTFEIFANKQAAEIEAVRAVLQGFVVSILSVHPQRATLFADLRSLVIARLDSQTKNASGDQDAKRKAEFVVHEATLIFDEMAPVFGETPKPPSSDRTN
jgi:hypothetical protein